MREAYIWWLRFHKYVYRHIIIVQAKPSQMATDSSCFSRAAGSRKRLYLRRRYIPQGRKNPMVSVVSYICVGYHAGGCRFSKWCKFFLEPKR